MAGEALSKSQANKIGEALRHGEMSADLVQRLSAYREQLVRNAQTAAEAIRALTLYPVTPREGKSTGSIVAKLQRQPIALSRIQDIVGCRVVVDSVVEQESLVLRMRARFRDANLIDRRLKPTHGYRAVHIVIPWEGASYEVQIRTRLQHAWAQSVERLSDRKFPGLKYGLGPGHILERVKLVSDVIAIFEEMILEAFENRSDPHAVEDTGRANDMYEKVPLLFDAVASADKT